MTSPLPSALSFAEETPISELTAQEQMGLENQKSKIAVVEKQIKKLSRYFIAYIGCKKIEQTIDTEELRGLLEDSSNSTGNAPSMPLGIVCFHNIEPIYINYIVRFVLDEQRRNMESGQIGIGANGDINVLPYVEFKLPQVKALKESFEITKQWRDPTNPLHNCLCPLDKDGAYWRNHQIDGKLVVSMITGAADTTSNIDRITSDDLKELIPDLFERFVQIYMQENKPNLHLDRYTIDYKQIQMVLKLLVHNDYFSVDLLELANYVANFIYLLEKELTDLDQLERLANTSTDLFDSDEDAKTINCGKLLGKALPQLLLPCNSKCFAMRAVTVRKRDYESAFSKLHKNCYGLKSRYNSRGNLLDPELLHSNFVLMLQKSFAAHNSKDNDGGMMLEAWETAAIKQYLDAFDDNKAHGEAFALLCHIEWNDKLEHLFALTPTREKKKLSTRTKEFFLAKAQKENPKKQMQLNKVITKDEAQLIELIDQKAQLTEDDLHNLYDFFQQHRSYFDQNKTLAKAWQKIIFTEQLAGEDFLFNISKIMLVLLAQQQEQTLLGVCFNLDMTTAELNKLNYDVATYFSCRYGPLLRDLSTICDANGNQLFKLLVRGAEVDPKLNPMLNYRNFFAAQQKKSRTGLSPSNSDKDEHITFKFEVMPLYADTDHTTPLKFTWSLSPQTVGIALDRDVAAVADSGSLQMGSFNYLAFSQQGQQQNLSLSNSATIAAFAPRTPLLQANSEAENTVHPSIAGFFFKDAQHLEVQHDISLLFKTIISVLRTSLERNNNGGFGYNPASTIVSLNAIESAYQVFAEAYLDCVQDLHVGAMSLERVQNMVWRYSNLQMSLMQMTSKLPDPKIVQNLLRLINAVGFAFIPHPNSFQATLASDLTYNPLMSAASAQPGSVLLNPMQKDRAWQEYYSASGALTLTPQFNTDYGNYAIATPLSVENMRAYAYKLAHIKELTAAVLQRDLYFSDQKLLERHLKTLLNYAEGPEIILGSPAQQSPILLSAQSMHGYTLYKNQDVLNNDLSKIKMSGANSNTSKGRGRSSKRATANAVAASAAAAASVSNSTIGTAAIAGAQESLGTYLSAVADYIESYLHRSAALTGQCSILIYNCGLVALPLALYQLLQNDPRFANTSFKLLILNDEIASAKDFYKIFEAECFRSQEINTKVDFIRRVQVEVLAENTDITEYLDNHQLSMEAMRVLGGDNGQPAAYSSFGSISTQDQAAKRLADICLLFHVFDAQAECSFSENGEAVTVVTDELHTEPSLVASSDISSTNSSSSYITSKMQPLSKIIYLHTMFFLTKGRPHLFIDAETKLEQLVQDPQLREHTHGRKVTVQAPLYRRSLPVMQSATTATTTKAHQLADVVLYFDALLGQKQLKDDALVEVSYYKQLKDSKLNFMLATNSSNYQGKSNVTNQLLQVFVKATTKEQQQQLIQQATTLTEQFFRDALSLSGSLVMHADLLASHSRELMGMVLARFIADQALIQLREHLPRAVDLCTSRFLLLEDYADLLGCKKEQLRRQLLCMQVLRYRDTEILDQDQSMSTPRYLLLLTVLESRFVAIAQNKDVNNSLKQANFVTDIFYRALRPHGDDVTLDRKPFLAMLANMLGHARDAQSTASILSPSLSFIGGNDSNDVTEVQQQLNQENIDILLKGCSFVCSFKQEASEANAKFKDINTIARISPNAIKDGGSYPVLQLAFYRAMVQQLVTNYQENEPQQLMEALLKDGSAAKLSQYFMDSAYNTVLEIRPQDLQGATTARDSAALQAATEAAMAKLSQARSKTKATTTKKTTSTRSKKTTAKAAK